MNAAFAELVIVASGMDVLTQEECPFQTPLLAPAHKSPNSGDFFYGAGLSGAFRSVRSYFVSSNRSRMEDFFLSVILRTSSWAFSSSSLWRPLLMISSIIPYSRPPGLFPPCAVGFRLYRNGHDLPVDAGEQLRPLELFGVLLDYVRGQGRKTLLPQAHQSGSYPPQCHKSPSARPRSQYQSSFRYVSFL